MTFSRCFKISSYCLVGSGFGALAATGALGPAAIALFSSVLALSWFVNPRRIRRSLPPWTLNGLAPLCIAFAAIDYGWLSRSWLAALLHMLLLASAAKLLARTRDGDYGFLYLASFAQLLVASTLTGNLSFLFWFLIFLISALGTLILFEMRRSHGRILDKAMVEPFIPSPASPARERSGMELFVPFPAGVFSVGIFGIALLVLAAAVPLFFLLPRITLGLYRQPEGQTRFVTGFSDRVELGRSGSLEQSDAVVMRVKTAPQAQTPGRELRWRGLAFDHFDGRSWSRSDAELRPVPVQGRFYKLEATAQGTRWIEQTYFVESLNTPVAFALNRALAVSRDVGALRRDASGNLYTQRPGGAKLRYTVISDAVDPDPTAISDRFPVPAGILRRYLRLPEMDPAIARRAREVTRTASGRYARARALEEHLRSNYAYSLKLGGPAGRDPLAVFLFDRRAGHCEYFASALAVMMRQEGIPSRLVNGYRSGDYNPIGGNWTVRQRHAHSWVEAYFPPYGWIEFDPTPATAPPSRHAFVRTLDDFRDAVDLWWWEGVVHYDSSHQHRVAGRLLARLDVLRNRTAAAWESARGQWAAAARRLRPPRRWPELPWRWTLWLALPALLALRPVRKSLRAGMERLRRRKVPRATAIYLEALDLLKARGFERARGQTPMEFARAFEPHPVAPLLLELTGRYNAARFGNPATPFREPDLGPSLRSLRNALDNNPGPLR